MSKPDTFVTLGGVSTFLLFIVALFHDVIRLWITQPKLAFELQFRPPDCHRVRTSGGWYHYFFAVRIFNCGRGKAENIEVSLQQLEKKMGDKWELVSGFNPDNLKWRLTDKGNLPQLNPKTYKQCNVGYIVDPGVRSCTNDEAKIRTQQDPNFARWLESENNASLGVPENETVFHLQVAFPSTNLMHLIGPGIYRLRLEASCSNGKPVTQSYELDLKGPWFIDEQRMLKDGIRIHAC